ncbi:magnesium-translocating P-type ATPase [Acidocella aromatica]|uniref:Magnesium-transporting ATPase, P-type 1 n=1 Tax=Acidocella aromatica TaxID=1303579 RepID=A0A840V9V9_9PROT|nr:Mg2+-importing ATPase [Acidocella aromatica]
MTEKHDLAEIAGLEPSAACARVGAAPEGLSAVEVAARLKRFGPNRVAREERLSVLAELWRNAKTPLNFMLIILAAVSWLLAQDARSAIVIAIMVVLSVGLGFIQEHRSSEAAAQLANMVKIHATVRRLGTPGADEEGYAEIGLDELVPGDIVRLSAGDMIPADVRLLTAKDVYVNQSALTGESMPLEKSALAQGKGADDLFALQNICFMGSNVISGFATALVVHTGAATSFGQLADKITGAKGLTSFDRGIAGFAGLMIRFIMVMAPAVFLINGLTKHNWLEAALFAVAVAVGLTPEMLPMIVTVNLARGAIMMARRRVIVKRLNAIQNFGAMDVLCTDKTGTLTQDRIIMKLHLDVRGDEDNGVLMLAYLNSHFQSGLKNVLDHAVLEHVELEEHLDLDTGFRKVDEIPFDFSRRRLSVVVRKPDAPPLLICKGAVEEILSVCTGYELKDAVQALDADELPKIAAVARALNQDGFRVVAVATREFPPERLNNFSAADEAGLTLRGFIAFLDPPKETAPAAIARLEASGVAVKIVTGDNDLVTRKVCRDVGLEITGLMLGREVEAMSDAELSIAAEHANVFAKVSPEQKARIIAALRARKHVVGFMGDGINDGPALKEADVGISVDTAVDIAKESAGIILLEKNLSVLNDGVLAGREVFGNIIKYIKMGASSNFGNMFSVLGASIFLPFLPMLPIQVLTNNLLYDFSQTAIPTDHVDEDYLTRPRKWELGNITRFMIFIGPISSLFDYATFFTMLYVFHCWNNPALFQTGWFVESILTQTLIIHIIRTGHIPFVQSWASPALIAATLIICGIGIALPFTPLGATLGFVPLPHLFWPIVGSFLLSYAVLTTVVKTWFIRRWGL